MMYFSPNGIPTFNKEQKQCEFFDKYKHWLGKAGMKCGILVQGVVHIVKK